ncbi:unnamed protein product [Sphacelaria rigidula]
MLLVKLSLPAQTLKSTMTLERLTQRIQEENDRVGKVNGRRFNIRSRKKMGWEMRNIEKSIASKKRRKKQGSNRSTYTKEELEEYKDIEDRFRADMRLSRAARETVTVRSHTVKVPETPAGTPERSYKGPERSYKGDKEPLKRCRSCSSLPPTPQVASISKTPPASSTSEPEIRRKSVC